MDPGDLGNQFLVLMDRLDGGRFLARSRWTGDLQLFADRLDAELPTVLVDVADYLWDGRSSSAAKKAEADFRISLDVGCRIGTSRCPVW